MFKLASLFVDIKADQAPFDKAMAGVKSQLSAANVAVGTFVGNIASMFAASAAGMAGNLFGGTIKSASNLNETISKTQTIFGDVSGSIIGQADAMASKFGLPKQAMLDAAGAMGLMAKGAGASGDETAAFSNKMVKLAADAMSFYNVPFDEALGKIRSGLSGESEPLRAFGVFLSEDAVKAEAAAMGIAKLGADLTEGQKVMARSSLIAKGLGDASGDLDRTFSGTENQTRAFWGTLANLGQDIGSVMLPAFNSLLEVASGAMRGLSGLWEENKATFAGWIAGIQEGIAAAKIAWNSLPEIFQIVRVKIAELTANILNVPAILSVAGSNVVTIARWIGDNWRKILIDAINATTTAFLNFADNLQNLGRAIGEWLADPTKSFDFSWKPLLTGFKATVDQFPELMEVPWISMQDQVDEISGKMAEKAAASAAGAVQAAGSQAKKFEQQQVAGKAGKEKEAGFKSEVMDTAEFARKLNISALSGGDDTPKKQLAAAEKTAKHTEEIAAAAKSPRTAVLG